MKYNELYYRPYKQLCETGKQTIYTKDINSKTIDVYYHSLLNIFSDGIETEEVQNMFVTIVFVDNESVDLSVFDYIFNLIIWQLNISIDKPIYSHNLFFVEDICKSAIKKYIDTMFIDRYRTEIPFIKLNQSIDNCLGKFRDIRKYQLYLSNSLSIFEDDIKLMRKYPEFNDTIHFDITGIPLEDLKDKGMQAVATQISYIKNSGETDDPDDTEHCLKYSFRTGEAISDKQYKEVAVNIGTKPDGIGGVFPHAISHSFMNGGLQTPEEITIDSSVGRIAQILAKTNVGTSGEFARKLELNNKDAFLNPDPTYVCDTKNFQEVTITNKTILDRFDLRYYRESKNGIDKLLDAKKDLHLIGKKLYFRSPMTCQSAVAGHGICYKCYGDLAYVNRDINIGQIAAEGLSSIYTQTLLSAKHLLESKIIKLSWSEGFDDNFKAIYDGIGLIPEKNYKGMYLIIDEDIKTDDDTDTLYNTYIDSFKIRYPDGVEKRIHTSDSDNLYLTPEFIEFINANKNKYINKSDDDIIEIDMRGLKDIISIFRMELKNSELSKTMDQIKKLIDNKSVISTHDRNSILEAFITTNISGGIKLNSVHYEVLLMSQIRDKDDDLALPDWRVPNQECQILTLSKSLSDNRSITTRLQTNKVSNVLSAPDNRLSDTPSNIDLFFMEQPQLFINSDIISDDNKKKDNKNIKKPLIFDNPKIPN